VALIVFTRRQVIQEGTGSISTSTAGERRHLTVFFYDPAGLAGIVTQLDGEDRR
jgi:hypothetical protein